MFRVKYCREIVLKILYQADLMKIPGGEKDELIERYFQSFPRVNDDENSFVRELIDLVFQNWKAFDEQISGNLVGWKLARLNPIERTLMRMGMAESRLGQQKAIIIDDIIRMSKKYSDQESYKFINAILDKVIP